MFVTVFFLIEYIFSLRKQFLSVIKWTLYKPYKLDAIKTFTRFYLENIFIYFYEYVFFLIKVRTRRISIKNICGYFGTFWKTFLQSVFRL